MAECLRYLFLSTHYRSDLSFSDKAIEEAKAALDNMYVLIQRLEESGSYENPGGEEEWERASKEFALRFQENMDDDFNTPKVLGTFHQLRGEVNKLLVKGLSVETQQKVQECFRKFGKPLGLFQMDPAKWKFYVSSAVTIPYEALQAVSSNNIGNLEDEFYIEQQIKLRNEARAKKDFTSADSIRKELADQGIILEDRPDGTTRWKR